MNSSDIARIAQTVVLVVSALTLTSAQTRAHRRPRPRRTAYAVAWIACTVMMGGLLVALDNVVGNATPGRIALSFAGMALVAGIALGIGAWWISRSAWSGLRGSLRFLSLLGLHALVVLALVLSFL